MNILSAKWKHKFNIYSYWYQTYIDLTFVEWLFPVGEDNGIITAKLSLNNSLELIIIIHNLF